MKKIFNSNILIIFLVTGTIFNILGIIILAYLNISVYNKNKIVLNTQNSIKEYYIKKNLYSAPIIIPVKSIIPYTKSSRNNLVIDISQSYSNSEIQEYQWDINNDKIFDYSNTIGILKLKYEEIKHMLQVSDTLIINTKIINNSTYSTDKVLVINSDKSFYVLNDTLGLHNSPCGIPIIQTDYRDLYEYGDTIWGNMCKKITEYKIDENIDGVVDYTLSNLDISFLFPYDKNIMRLHIGLYEDDIKMGDLYWYFIDKVE